PDQLGGLEGAEQAAEIARVEVEPGPQAPYVAPVDADLPEQTRLSQRPVPREIAIVEGADALGDQPVEAAHLADSHVEHSLILVREYAGRQRRAAFYKPARGAASPPSQLKPPTAVAITATMISRRRRRKSNACERIMRWLPSPDSPGPRRSVDRVERSVSHVLRARSSLERGTGGRPRLRPAARS